MAGKRMNVTNWTLRRQHCQDFHEMRVPLGLVDSLGKVPEQTTLLVSRHFVIHTRFFRQLSQSAPGPSCSDLTHLFSPSRSSCPTAMFCLRTWIPVLFFMYGADACMATEMHIHTNCSAARTFHLSTSSSLSRRRITSTGLAYTARSCSPSWSSPSMTFTPTGLSRNPQQT